MPKENPTSSSSESPQVRREGDPTRDDNDHTASAGVRAPGWPGRPMTPGNDVSVECPDKGFLSGCQVDIEGIVFLAAAWKIRPARGTPPAYIRMQHEFCFLADV
jgi:hypothetical protein